MKADYFDKQMGQIAAQAEKERLDEVRVAKRRLLFARIRKVVLVLALLGAAAYGYTQRSEIGQRVEQLNHKLFAKPSTALPEGAKGQLGDIQAAAAKRDQLVDQFSK